MSASDTDTQVATDLREEPAVAAPSAREEQAAGPGAERRHSYTEILRSSALIGAASMLTIAIGIVRTKAMAVLLGPAGFGLLGLYASVADLAVSIAGLGIVNSGVRQIAESVGSGDEERIARTVVVLRRTAVVLGLLGAVLLAAASSQVSTFTFGSDRYAGGIALLGLAVFFRLLADGRNALIQGLRRIADLAGMQVSGALLGTIAGVATVYVLREDGVVLSLVLAAAMASAAAWWYSRRVEIRPAAMTVAQVREEASALLRLGFAFMVSAVLVMGTAYAVRAMLLHTAGLEAAGFYQAAWTLGGLYVGIILQAMAADFYPRLTAVARDHARCNQLVNEQAQVSLLLAGPGVIATITFSPLVVWLFYSAEFGEAVDVLRWVCLGMTLRVISWPMGFIILARNERKLFLGSEIAWTAVHLGLAWVCIETVGLDGAGIAFFGSYVFHVAMIYWLVRALTGFRWSAENTRLGLAFLLVIAAIFGGFYVLPPPWATVFGSAALLGSGLYSLRVLVSLVPVSRIPPSVQRLLLLLRLLRADAAEGREAL